MKHRKTTVAVILNNDTTVHSLLLSGALKELRERFNIEFIYSDNVNFPLSEGVRIDFFKKRNKFIKFVDYHLWYLTFYKLFRKTIGLKEGFKNYKISMLSRKGRTILNILTIPLIYDIVYFFTEKLIIRYEKKIYNCLKKINPEIVILPAAAFDSFCVEIIKCAKKLHIKSVMCVLNWDFFSNKGLLRAKTDIVCIWGQQMYEMATGHIHRISPDKVRIIGVPQYEIYKNKISAGEARRYLNLSADKRIWLFAGIGETYDEMSVLMEIDELIGTELPSDILVLYRPHPKKHALRKNEKDFKEYKFKNIVLDPENANMIKKAGGTPFEYYANLIYSVDAFISPFSTMALEAIFCGKPCLTIGFSDDLHKWKLEYTWIQDHVKPLLYWKSLLLCLDKSNFRNSLKTLMEISDKSAIGSEIKEEIGYIIYADNEPYSKKLLDVILDIGGGK